MIVDCREYNFAPTALSGLREIYHFRRSREIKRVKNEVVSYEGLVHDLNQNDKEILKFSVATV